MPGSIYLDLIIYLFIILIPPPPPPPPFKHVVEQALVEGAMSGLVKGRASVSVVGSCVGEVSFPFRGLGRRGVGDAGHGF